MKKMLSLMAAAMLVLLACQKTTPEVAGSTDGGSLPILRDKPQTVEVPSGDPMSKAALDQLVIGTLEEKGDFRWEWMSFDVLWSAIQYGDHSVAIGYKPTGVGNIEDQIHQLDLTTGKWKETHDALIELVISSLSVDGRAVTPRDVIIEDDPVLPIITFKLTDRDVLTKLYNLENVRYVEPLDYWPGTDADRSSSGCSGSTYTVNTGDYSTYTPSCKVPWNYFTSNIPTARNSTAGYGVTIGVIDAGISSSQTLLGSAFSSGDSNVGRSITTDYTFGSSAYTACTHGTSMCGVAAGPRTNTGATVGVAYKSNLHFIRACEDVVLDLSSERTGVKNALVKMGQKADVKVISMSIGTPFYSSVLYDGVVYAYNMGKMIMAAAGTSFSWTSWWGVIYPAAHSQCVAVTGVNENYNTCSDCHDGSEVDFTIVMERNADDNRNSLSLKQSGSGPSYVGGSSVATSTAAGIAGLVWSVNPNFSREQVFNFMKTTSQYYPGWSSYAGYGKINASGAVAAAQAAI